MTRIQAVSDAVQTVVNMVRSGSWVSGHSKDIVIIVKLLSLDVASVVARARRQKGPAGRSAWTAGHVRCARSRG